MKRAAFLLLLLTAALPMWSDTAISGNIGVNTTWTVAGSPYILTGDVTVGSSSGVTLTIEPGVVVKANTNAHFLINFSNKGALVANGTAENPILFTANNASSPGSWFGLRFGTIASPPASSISHITVEYAGSTVHSLGGITVAGGTPSLANVTSRNHLYAGIKIEGGSPSISSSTVRDNGGFGVYMIGGEATLTDVALLSNSSIALSAHASAQLNGMSGITAIGNGTNAVEYRAGDISASRTWKTCAIPYVVAGSIHVKGSSAPILTIEPGNTIKFNANSQIAVNWQDKGGLSANGTVSAPILFTSSSATPTPGIWWGLYFGETAGNTPSSLSYATIEYGGWTSVQRGGVTIYNTAPTFDHVTIANSAFAGAAIHGAGASFTDSTITASSGPGIHGINAATLSLVNTAITDNNGYAVTVHAATAFTSTSGLTATGNTQSRNAIEIRGGDIAASRTWTTSAIPYVVNGGILVRGSAAPILTIEPGNTIRFNGSSQIAVNFQNKGGLVANGTALAPILFTSNVASPTPGAWWGLYFGENAGAPTSSVSHATIEYGGYPGVQRGGVTVYNVVPQFTNVTIRNSAYAGVALHGAGISLVDSTITTTSGPGIYGINNPVALTLSGSSFTTNDGYAVSVPANSTFTDLSGLSASGNGTGRNGIELRQGVITSDRTWPATALPYIVSGNLDVYASSSPILTIAAGNTIKFNANAQLVVNHNTRGGLRANGTEAAPILFTSNTTSTQGAWLGLWFGPTVDGPQSNVTWATIEYGGATGHSRGGITAHALTPLFDHVTVRNNQYGGLVVTGGAPVVRDSLFHANGGPGINTTSTSAVGLTLTNDTFTNNSGHAVTLPASVPFEASGLSASGNGTGRDSVELRAAVIAANRTWPNPGLPYVITGYVDVYGPSAPILTIAAGNILRFNAGAQITINHNDRGGLQAHGTASAPIVFTSNGTATPGYWLGLWFGPRPSPPQSNVSYAVFEYGGGTNRGGIAVNAGSPQFDHLTLRANLYAGLSTSGTSSPRITNSHFHDNPAGVRTNDQSIAVAKLNYWNLGAGPCLTGCATGQQSVTAAVQFEPWLTSAPTDPQFVITSVQMNRAFSPAIGAKTTVDYTTALTGDVAVTIRNASNATVRTFTTSGTAGQFIWDGKDGSGSVQPDGSYTFELASTAVSQPPAAIARGVAVIDSTRGLTLSAASASQAFFSPNEDTIKDTTTVSAVTNYDDSTWTVTVRDASNNVVRTHNGSGGSVSYAWDGKNDSSVVQPDGLYTLRIDAAQGSGAAQSSATTTLDNTLPAVAVTTPLANGVLSNVHTNGVTNITPQGSVSDVNLQNWTFDLGAGASPTSWNQLGANSTPVSNGNLGFWATENVSNGTYAMRLVANDKAGNTAVFTISPLTLGNFKATQSAYQFNAGAGQTLTYTSTVPFPLTETIVVKNEAGAVVRNLVAGVARNAGTFNDVFNGRNDANTVLPDGPYFYFATVTDGTHTFTWDLTNVFRNDFGGWNDDLHIQAYDPFENKAMTFNYNFGQPGRVTIATTTTPGSVIGNCASPTSTFFCPVIDRWEEAGPKSFTWSGIDHTGTYRTIRSAAIVIATNKFPKNAAVMFGAKAKVTNVKATPTIYGPMSGTQTIEFDLTTFQSQPANVTISLVNLSSKSVLRTLTLNAQAAGHVTTTWNGRADNDMLVAPGRYAVVVTANDAQGNAINGDILTTIQY